MSTTEEEGLQVDETEETDDDEVRSTKVVITSYPADYTLKVLYDKWKSDQIKIPDFQRRYIWNNTQASRLIESFLLGLPIPQIFLYRERSSPVLTVIDGQQRLGAIAQFYNEELRLKGVDSAWEGKSYSELDDYDRSQFDDATLRAIVIRQIQPDDDSSAFQIFERLNTGGTQLNDMEIRRAIFRGKANGFLEELNNNDDWRKLIGMAESTPRFRDVELVLRVLALAESWRDYSKPMKHFITAYMRELDKSKGDELKELEARFTKACSDIVTQLGAKPFHLRSNRLNLAAMDSVMACSIELGESLGPNLAEEYDQLKKEMDFLEFVTHNTSDYVAVTGRFKKVHSAFGSK